MPGMVDSKGSDEGLASRSMSHGDDEPLSAMGVDQVSWRDLDKNRFYVLQFSVFMLIRAMLYPSNVIKTHMQVSNDLKGAASKHVGSVLRSVVRDNGVSGLWRGFWTVALGIVPSQMVYITTYEITKERLSDMNSPLSIRTFLAGGSASFASQFVMVPVDVVSQTMMLQRADMKHGAFATMTSIVRKRGVTMLYRGFAASVAVYAPYSGIWWSTYSTCKHQLYKLRARSEPDSSASLAVQDLALQSISGMAAAICGVIFTSPFDIVKTRLQTTHSHLNGRTIAFDLYRSGGVAAFWKGASARLLGSLPFSVLGILGYEFVKRSSVAQS